MDTISKEDLDRLLSAMIQSHDGISDLLFVAGKAPQVEAHGKLKEFAFEDGEPPLTSERIRDLAMAILEENPKAAQDLMEQGSCDCSYSLGEACRFRVN